MFVKFRHNIWSAIYYGSCLILDNMDDATACKTANAMLVNGPNTSSELTLVVVVSISTIVFPYWCQKCLKITN